MRLKLAFLFLSLGGGTARAQPAFFDVAPLEVSQDGWFDLDKETLAILVGTKRTVPLYYFLPDVSEDSRFDVLGFSAGIRDEGLAWAIRPFDALIVKAPWAVGLGLLSYDRTGAMGIEANWLGLRGGPAFRAKSFHNSFEIRILGRAGLGTVSETGGLFQGPLEASTGLDTGLRAELVTRLRQTAILALAGGRARLLAGSNPRRDQASASLTLWPAARFTAVLKAGRIEMESDRYRRTGTWLIEVGVRIRPAGEPGF